MSRHFRRAKILELIEAQPIDTQEELVEQLQKANFKITQATISRDIRELGLIKVEYGDKFRYARDVDKAITITKIKDIFRTSIVSYDLIGNFLVLKTLGGMANAAINMMEQINHEGIAGCVGNNDTVFVMLKNAECGSGVMDAIEQILD